MARKKNIKKSKDKLVTIFEATAKETGGEFFEALIFNLASSLNTYGAWANVYNEDQSKAKSLAFLIDGELLPNFEYEIKNTPCETVINNDTLHHVPDNLIEIYPDDPEIKEDVILLVRCGSGYSFTSSHATNHFAIASFLIMTLVRKEFWLKTALLFCNLIDL